MAGKDNIRAGKRSGYLAAAAVAILGILLVHAACAPTVIELAGGNAGQDCPCQVDAARDDAILTVPAAATIICAPDALVDQMVALNAAEDLLLSMERDVWKILAYIEQLARADAASPRRDDAIHDATEMLALLEKGWKGQTRAWAELDVPEARLQALCDIKTLQLNAALLTVLDSGRFLRTRDQLFLEYAKEHRRQAEAFKERFDTELARIGEL